MSKRLENGFLLLMIAMILCGCGQVSTNNDNSAVVGKKDMKQEIRKVIVTYEEDIETQIEIEVNLQTGKRAKSMITKQLAETEDTYENADELRKFLEENVILSTYENPSKSESDDQKIKWSVKVSFDNGEESYKQYGFHEYPEYWDKLLEVMER